jgi:hypothetical protein
MTMAGRLSSRKTFVGKDILGKDIVETDVVGQDDR